MRYMKTYLIKAVILLLVLWAVSVKALAEQTGTTMYLIEAEIYANDSSMLKNVTAIYGQESHFLTIDTGYSIAVLSYDHRTLFTGNLNLFRRFVDPLPGKMPSQEIGIEQDNKDSLLVTVPYFKTATEISIYHHNKTLVSINLTNAICNMDGTCNLGENRHNCPKDCGVNENGTYTKSDGLCNYSNGKNPDCPQPGLLSGYLGWMVAVLFLLIVVCVFALNKKRSEQKTLNEREEFLTWKAEQERLKKA
jgi:hypothetical protein